MSIFLLRHYWRYRSVAWLLLAWKLLINSAHGQGQADNWYFGANAGLIFRNGPPQLSLTGQCCNVNAGIVPVTVSDSTGTLLFYSDGQQVWDRTHMLMPNGGAPPLRRNLGNNGLIAQAVPWPGRPNRYFLVGSAADVSNNFQFDLQVAEVDMSLNGGRGDVVAATIGRVFTSGVDMTITVARHANGRDFWLITHDFLGTQFRAYAITPAGLSPTPVMSAAGLPNSSPLGEVTYGRFSPNGRRFCRAGNSTANAQLLEVLQFNAATGRFATDYTLTLPGQAQAGFGEFSPDSKKYYLSSAYTDTLTGLPATYYLSQFNLAAATPAAVQASRIDFAVSSIRNSGLTSLQLASDGRIYVGPGLLSSGFGGLDSVGVIRYPNRAGAACGYVPNGLWLGPRIPAGGVPGGFGRGSGPLPYFISTYLYLADFTTASVCFGDSARFTLRYPARLDSVRWRFNDPAVPGGGSSSRRPVAAYRYAQPGTYRAQVQVFYNDGATDTLSHVVTVRPAPTVALPATALLCPEAPLTLQGQVSAGVTAYRWSTGATTPTLSVTQPGTYSLTVTTDGCPSTATTQVRAAPVPILRLPADTLLCLDTELRLSGAAPGVTTVRWPDGSTDPTYVVRQPGPVRVQLTTTEGCLLTRTVQVRSQECPDQLVIPNIITPNGDDKNDGFQITGLEPGAWRLEVYNRWGRAVYEQSGYHSGEWRADEQPDGMYYYRLTRPGQQRKGWVEVVR